MGDPSFSWNKLEKREMAVPWKVTPIFCLLFFFLFSHEPAVTKDLGPSKRLKDAPFIRYVPKNRNDPFVDYLGTK